MGDLQRGVVKWFNDAKGFGFIEHSTGRDVFVHYSVIEWEGFKTLKDGEEVDYELREGDKGLHASKVVRSAAMKKKIEKEARQVLDGHINGSGGESPPENEQSLLSSIEIEQTVEDSSNP